MKTFHFLLFALALLAGTATWEMRADNSKNGKGFIKNQNFIITDIQENKTKVTGLKILITGGSRTYYSKTFEVLKGEATLTLTLDELAGLIHDWSNKEITLFFTDGKILKAKLIIDPLESNYIIGTAIIADAKVPFKLERQKIKSIFMDGFQPPPNYKKLIK